MEGKISENGIEVDLGASLGDEALRSGSQAPFGRNLSRRNFVRIAGASAFITLSSALFGCSLSSQGDSEPEPVPSEDAAPAEPVNVSVLGEPLTQEEIDYYMYLYTRNLTEERTGRPLLHEEVERIRRFCEQDDGQPFYMINLVREYDEPTYPDWWEGDKGGSVLECKKMYSEACYPIMATSGTRSVMGVAYASDYVLVEDENAEPWDQFYLVAYPNRKAFMKLLISEEYADAIVHKYAGDKDTQLIPVTGNDIEVLKVYEAGEPMSSEEIDSYMERYTSNLIEERTGHPLDPAAVERIRRFCEQDDGQPFYMINLVREYDEPTYPDWWEGDKGGSVLECKKMYSEACYPIMAQSGSFSLMGVCFTSDYVLTDDEGAEPWDQFYLISYPSRRAFMNLLASEEYADAIVHKYAGDKDTQLIPVTPNEITVTSIDVSLAQ